MTILDDAHRTDVFAEAGLPQDGIAAWRSGDDIVSGDFRRDTENFSRQWRIGAELIAHLPAKPQRSAAQGAAAAAILQRDRAARESFLAAHAETAYRRLTGNLAKFVRVETLVRDVAAIVPGLVRTARSSRAKTAGNSSTKTALKSIKACFFHGS